MAKRKSFQAKQHIASTKIKPKTAPAVTVSPYSVDTGGMTQTTTIIEGPDAPAPKLDPVVFVMPDTYQKMQHIVDKCELEVGWFCSVEKLSASDYLLKEVFLPEQEVTAVETDISASALATAFSEAMSADICPSTIYAWFHSHVNMDCRPSGQDEQQVEEFLTTCPVFIRGIMNKRGDIKVDLYLRDEGIAYNCVEVRTYHPPISLDVIADLNKQISAKVKRQAYTMPLPYKSKGINHVSPLAYGVNAYDKTMSPYSTTPSAYSGNDLLWPGEDDLGDIPYGMNRINPDDYSY